MKWPLTFITEQQFTKHVQLTIKEYGENLESYDLENFNRNLIDPIKLVFDKSVYGCSWDEIIKNEIFRQRDKSNNNAIGYFHQKIFQYISDCQVPNEGWDVIYKKQNGIDLPTGDKVSTIYVEMKNKHNTMNSAAAGKTYIKMQSQLLKDDDCACFLVEAIAKKSQNITWAVTVDKTKQSHKRIRRVSMDEFYKIVTGQEDAFYQMCMILPDVIDKVVRDKTLSNVPNDTVSFELEHIAKTKNGSFVLALYMLGFGTYIGFDKE